MKRFIIILTALLMMNLFPHAASAEPLGWGFVNDTDVALRRGVGGKVLVRLPKDTCVWINDSYTDSDGILWYEISSGLHIDNANYDFVGWMKAEFIDAGEKVWHDIIAIAASNNGLIVMRADGSTETAGRPVVAVDGSAWVSPKGWTKNYGKAIHVGVPNSGNEYFIVTENDELVSSVNGISITNGLQKAAELEKVEAFLKDRPFPVWYNDTETTVFRTASVSNPEGSYPLDFYIGVRADGSVVAEPKFLAELLVDWSDIIDVRITDHSILGLKGDGTVVLATHADGTYFNIAQWHSVVAIGAGSDWCVGLKEDGTLLFEGDHHFMNEGHIRK